MSLAEKGIENLTKYEEKMLRKMVADAAKYAFSKSKIVDKDGNLVVMYHGTNGGDFTRFDWSYTQRADAGFYGRGHYFTNSYGGAEVYGSRVIPVYLNITKPFNFDSEAYGYNGKTFSDGKYIAWNVATAGALFCINMSEQFPELFGDNYFEYWHYDGTKGRQVMDKIKWSDMRGILETEMNSDRMQLLHFGDDTFKWQYTAPGKIFGSSSWDFYPDRKSAMEGKLLDALDLIFSRTYNFQFPLDPAAYYLGGDMDAASAFTEALKKKGYDGTIQDDSYEEVVAFYSKQIKSAEPITYDKDGNIIPLSERFRTDRTGDEAWKNNDILYSANDSFFTEQADEELSEDRKRLQAENESLRGTVENLLTELINTRGLHYTVSSIRKPLKKLMSQYSIDRKTVGKYADDIKRTMEYYMGKVASSPDAYDDFFRSLNNLANKMLDDVVVKETQEQLELDADNISRLKQYFNGKKYKVTQDMIEAAGAEKAFGLRGKFAKYGININFVTKNYRKSMDLWKAMVL